MNLNEASPKDTGKIIKFTKENKKTRRLLEMGIIPGRTFTYIRKAPFGGPIEIKLGVSNIVLRQSEAKLIIVKIDQ